MQKETQKNKMIKKALYIEKKRSLENQKKVDKLFFDAGWVGEYDVSDLYLIERSEEDLPFPEIEYEGEDANDWVSDSGQLLLPAVEIPYCFGSNSFFRPEPKEVWYNGNWFICYFFHNGALCDIEKINK